jgi:hypothetical protein
MIKTEGISQSAAVYKASVVVGHLVFAVSTLQLLCP